MLFTGSSRFPLPGSRPRASRSWWSWLWQQPAGPVREPSVPPPPTPPLPPTSSNLSKSTSPHPSAAYPLLTLRVAETPGRLGNHLIFRIIQKIDGSPRPHPASCASGRSFFFFFSLWCRSSSPSDQR